ncbi:MAG: hypothetical protein K9I29_06500 [Bacteroidales bacterium]|nr:hypothetical protein [Bacteroidales bacterium]MCF8327929.1 hypothetical protein [Bacteroidales bacterium]
MYIFNRIKIILFFILFAGLWGCEIIDPEDPVPGYIYIEDIETQTTAGEGTARQNFSEAWVFLDQDLVGAFELPARIPVIAEGKHTIGVKPGIKINGISSTRSGYPFVEQYETEVDIEKEKIDTLHPKTHYFDEVKFPWNSAGQEDFEQGGVSLDSTKESDVQIIRQGTTVFEGNQSGLIELDSAGMKFQIESTTLFPYPGQNVPVFLELHYQADNSFVVGTKLYLNTGNIKQNPILIVRPHKDTWNKIYINLTPTLTRENRTTEYQIYFSGNVNQDMNNAKIYLDNIKLVTAGS